MIHALLFVQYAGIAILALEILFTLFQSPSKFQRDMLTLLISLLIVFVAYTAEMNATNLQAALVAIKFGYLGKPFVVLSMLFLILDYCRIRLPNWLTVSLILLQSLSALCVFTSERHLLYYSTFDFTTDGLFPHAVLGHGPCYVAYMTILLFYCIAIFAVCFSQLKQTESKRERHQIILFIIMVLIPLVCLGVFMTGVFRGYDCTLPGYLFSTIGFSISFFGLNLFDTITLAKEQAVDYIHCGLMVYDTRGRLIYCNQLADQLEIRDKIPALVRSGEPYPFEGRLYSIEDREITKDDVAYGHMIFLQDVTDRYGYERMLKDEKQRADDASRAKSEFLFSMSHDIRTPMNAILGMANIAAAHLDDPQRVSDCLSKITMSGEHLLGVINEILDMNKIESGKMELVEEPFDINVLLDEVLTMAAPLADRMGHTLITGFSDLRHTAVRGDKNRLSQILMNILGNAVKYTPRGGVIRFTVSEKDAPPQDAQAAPVYRFIVQDNGIGMSEDYLPKLFEPFTREKGQTVSRIQGTGLGMAITKRFVELMHGVIRVESRLGEGSCFTVELPLAALPPEQARELTKQVTMEDFSALGLSAKRILLVEDNELNAEIAGEILAMAGLAVEYACDGGEAVERIASCEDGYYDLVFMDIQMPVMDGYAATRAIRALDSAYARNVPIIAMTANAFQEDADNARAAGMNDYIAKPLELDRLMRLLQNWFMDME